MIIFQSTWPKLGTSPCSYQVYLVILLCLVVPFFAAPGAYCSAFYLELSLLKIVCMYVQCAYDLYHVL